MIINKLDRLNINRETGSGNYRIIATVKDTVDGIDNQFNELNSQNGNLIVSNKHNVVTERDCVSIMFSGSIGDTFSIKYQQWVILLDEESYYDILVDTVTLQEATKLYYFREDIDTDSYSIGEVDALLALKANLIHTHSIADIDDLDTVLSVIESDILLKADSDHNHDSSYHPLNGNINLGYNSNWNIHDDNGTILLVDNDNHEIVSLWPIEDASVNPSQGVAHSNRPNLDSINQNLATTDNVVFNRLTVSTSIYQDTLDIIGDNINTPLYVRLRSFNNGDVVILMDGSGGEVSGGNYCSIGANANNILGLYGKGGISLYQQVRLANVTTTTRNAITPANGDMIYNTTTNKFQGYANGTWVDLH